MINLTDMKVPKEWIIDVRSLKQMDVPHNLTTIARIHETPHAACISFDNSKHSNSPPSSIQSSHQNFIKVIIQKTDRKVGDPIKSCGSSSHWRKNTSHEHIKIAVMSYIQKGHEHSSKYTLVIQMLNTRNNTT